MTKVKQFSLNGEFYKVNKDITIFELIQYFDYNGALIVLEYNNVICNKKNWKKVFIKHNDMIEIVTIVGGG